MPRRIDRQTHRNVGSFCRQARLSDFSGLPGFAQSRGERFTTAPAGNLEEMRRISLDPPTVPLRYSAECRRKRAGEKAGFPHRQAAIPEGLTGGLPSFQVLP